MSLNILQRPSPNHWNGRSGYKPEIIVIHVMDGSLAGTDNWFGSINSQVSAHYGVGNKGEVHQYVQEKDAAWHAGIVVSPTFKLLKPKVNPNWYTIGIEHEGKAGTVWSDAMKSSSAQLIADICQRWNIPLDRDHVIGHYQVYANKPNCPAINKGIIDELLELAKNPTYIPPEPPIQSSKVNAIMVLLQQIINLLKS